MLVKVGPKVRCSQVFRKERASKGKEIGPCKVPGHFLEASVQEEVTKVGRHMAQTLQKMYKNKKYLFKRKSPCTSCWRISWKIGKRCCSKLGTFSGFDLHTIRIARLRVSKR